MKEVEASRWTLFKKQLLVIWTGSGKNSLFAAIPAPVLSSTIPPQVDIFTFLRKLCPGLPARHRKRDTFHFPSYNAGGKFTTALRNFDSVPDVPVLGSKCDATLHLL